MAGIGFELKKLFKSSEDTPFAGMRAFLFSAAVSVGPWFITATSLNLLILISNTIDLSRNNQMLFMSTIFYVFIFSQIVTNAFQYLVTRYVSDCIFNKEILKIKGAYIGCIKLVSMVSFLLSVVFIRNATLSSAYKVSFVVLFVSMSLSWITMIFISLLKKYKFILFCFFIGNSISIILGYVFLKYPVTFIKEDPIFWMLFSYTVGIFLNFILTSMYIMRAFPGKGKNHFEFFIYFKGYFSLVLIGVMYILGIWGHVFVNWFVGDSYTLANVFLVSPIYEVAVFYGYCTVIPSMIYFAVFMETKFLPLFKDYFNKLCISGNYEKIKESLKILRQTLISEVLYCMELQLLISITCILLSNIIFNELDMDAYLLDLFRIVVFGSYSSIFISILITLFLYFDLRFQAMILSLIMFITSFLFTYIFGKMGVSYTGFGFFLSSALTFVIGVYMFYRLFDTLNYTVMFRQNFNYSVGGNFVKNVSQLFNKRVYILILIIILFLLGNSKTYGAYDKQGFNKITRNNWDTMSPFDREGYDIEGYNREGIDRRNFNRVFWNTATNSPYDYSGFDYHGIHKDTKKEHDERGFNYEYFNVITNSVYDVNGFNHEGIHKDTGREYDKNGWNYYGLNEKTKDYYNEDGWTFEGINRKGFNREGYNIWTKRRYDYADFDFQGINKNTKTRYDEREFDNNQIHRKTGTKYDERGFDYEGKNKDTGTEYDKNGWNFYGLNQKTKTFYDVNGYTREGLDMHGYKKGKRPKNFGANGGSGEYDRHGFDKHGIYQKGY